MSDSESEYDVEEEEIDDSEFTCENVRATTRWMGCECDREDSTAVGRRGARAARASFDRERDVVIGSIAGLVD